MPDTSALQAAILRVLGAGPAEGLRVAELRVQLQMEVDAVTVQTSLMQLSQQGRLQRDHSGRWSVPSWSPPARSTEPAARAPRRIIPAEAAPVPAPGARAPGRRSPSPAAVVPVRLPEVPDAGIPPRAADGSFQLDATQRPIAHAAPDARLIVEAGPGHGKTAVACARVAHLLEQGVPGTQILLLSFTRTAVREMRQRIRELAQAGTDVADIRIATIDSWATRLRTGFLGDAAMTGSFDDGIRRTLSLLRAPTGDLADRLRAFRHILVDEAQDLVGLRAQLIEGLLRAVSPECGFTVFLDPAQGIYDWAEDGLEEGEEPTRFVELLRGVTGVQPPVALGHLHRTADPELRRLLLGARSLVLDPELPEPASRLRSILAERMNPNRPDWKALVPTLPEDALILFRRRGSALDASAWLAGAGIPHRLRIGGLPQPVAPWVAALLHDAYERNGRNPSLKRHTCEAAWNALGQCYLIRGWTFERAWPALIRMAEGGTRIDVRKIADALLLGQVPDDLYTRELGPGGPVLGTVHGSKGREGSRVVFAVPSTDEWTFGRQKEKLATREARESRALYVAITRAKEHLDLYDGGSGYWRKWNGRDWRHEEGDRVRIEVGREGDLDAARAAAVEPDGMSIMQNLLRTFDGTPRAVIATRGAGNFATAWEIRDESGASRGRGDGQLISMLIEKVDQEMFDLLGHSELRRTWNKLVHLYQLDITTMPLRPDHPALDRLPEPWRTLRLILAPVVVGLGSTYARKR